MCDEYTYSHLVEAMVGPKGYNAVPVPMDNFGMTPEFLDKVSSESCCTVNVKCMCMCVIAKPAASIKLPCDKQALMLCNSLLI